MSRPSGERALVVRGPGDVGLEPRPLLQEADGHLVVRPDLVGLCSTDLEIIDGSIDPAYIRYPVVLGHEWTGTVAGDSGLGGQRVVVEGIIPCWHCARCLAGEANLCETYDEIGFTRDGAAAGQIRVPADRAHVLSPALAPEDAVLTEPCAVVYRGLSRARPEPGFRVLVIGDGTIGLLAVAIARLWSPAEVVLLGQRPGQAGLARLAGASRMATDPAAVGAGYDLVVEAAGATSAVAAALAAPRRGGTVLLLGLPPHGHTVPLPVDDTVNNDLTILGSFSYDPASWRAVVGLLNAGRLSPAFVVTQRFGLADWADAIATLRGSASPRGKVLLTIG